MESKRIPAQCAEAEASDGETTRRAAEVCGNGACPRQGRGRFSGTNETQGVNHGKAEAVGGEAPHNSASAVYRAPGVQGKSASASSGGASPREASSHVPA